MTGSTGSIHFSNDSLAWVAAVLCMATGSISFLCGFASQDVLTKELCRQQRAQTLAEQSREPESPKSNDVASGMDTPS